ncbi:MAG: heat shock protein [Lasallia pustulata]|uniref:Heat shock protein n=1 Tax=Lasallia pustulata TaxID=136370 RepID=A0A5M8Q176_9LECA|nr:MAG: heat shock protein [Lasallia pustulata]
MSAFFQPLAPNSDFTSLFRLLDDYDTHRSQPSSTRANSRSTIRAFQPRFDVEEVSNAYELHGELPGIAQKDVSIEFTDPHTLVIKGRTEREYSAGTPPAAGAIEADGAGAETPSSDSYHKATVEDEDGAENAEAGENGSTEVAKQAGTGSEVQKAPQAQHRYWVSERMVGEFHRSFSFPTRVDQDKVKASLKNGILTVVVPKASAPQSKKIQIE